jgi:hypothetical protein
LIAHRDLRNISSSSKLQRAPEVPLQPNTVQTLKEAYEAVRKSRFISVQATKPDSFVQVHIEEKSRETRSSDGINCPSALAMHSNSILMFQRSPNAEEISPSSTPAAHPPGSLKSASSSDSFKSAVDEQEPDIEIVREVEGVLHAFRTALEVLEKVKKRIDEEDKALRIEADMLTYSLMKGLDINQAHGYHHRRHGAAYLRAFRDSQITIRQLQEIMARLMGELVTTLHMYSAAYEVLSPAGFQKIFSCSEECRIRTLFELDKLAMLLFPQPLTLIFVSSSLGSRSEPLPLKKSEYEVHVSEYAVDSRLSAKYDYLLGSVRRPDHRGGGDIRGSSSLLTDEGSGTCVVREGEIVYDSIPRIYAAPSPPRSPRVSHTSVHSSHSRPNSVSGGGPRESRTRVVREGELRRLNTRGERPRGTGQFLSTAAAAMAAAGHGGEDVIDDYSYVEPSRQSLFIEDRDGGRARSRSITYATTGPRVSRERVVIEEGGRRRESHQVIGGRYSIQPATVAAKIREVEHRISEAKAEAFAAGYTTASRQAAVDRTSMSPQRTIMYPEHLRRREDLRPQDIRLREEANARIREDVKRFSELPTREELRLRTDFRRAEDIIHQDKLPSTRIRDPEYVPRGSLSPLLFEPMPLPRARDFEYPRRRPLSPVLLDPDVDFTLSRGRLHVPLIEEVGNRSDSEVMVKTSIPKSRSYTMRDSEHGVRGHIAKSAFDSVSHGKEDYGLSKESRSPTDIPNRDNIFSLDDRVRTRVVERRRERSPPPVQTERVRLRVEGRGRDRYCSFTPSHEDVRIIERDIQWEREPQVRSTRRSPEMLVNLENNNPNLPSISPIRPEKRQWNSSREHPFGRSTSVNSLSTDSDDENSFTIRHYVAQPAPSLVQAKNQPERLWRLAYTSLNDTQPDVLHSLKSFLSPELDFDLLYSPGSITTLSNQIPVTLNTLSANQNPDPGLGDANNHKKNITKVIGAVSGTLGLENSILAWWCVTILLKVM